MKFCIDTVYQSWKCGQVEDSSMGLTFFLYYHQLKYPNANLRSAIEKKEIELSLLKKFQFKKVKAKALIALQNWCEGHWKFVLLDKIPTPYEVLRYQCQGVRPVTIKIQSELAPILNRSDCLDFFLHDLEHGYMFFHDEALKTMQMSFFNKVQSSLTSDLWQPYLAKTDFLAQFYYLISDMNTHLQHYRHYLKAHISPEDFDRFEILFESD